MGTVGAMLEAYRQRHMDLGELKTMVRDLSQILWLSPVVVAQVLRDHMVGTRLPQELVRELQFIEEVEQSDRSTTVRRLLARAIQQWKLEHYVRLYGDGKLTLARAAQETGVSLWE